MELSSRDFTGRHYGKFGNFSVLIMDSKPYMAPSLTAASYQTQPPLVELTNQASSPTNQISTYVITSHGVKLSLHYINLQEQLYTDSVPVVADEGKEDGDFLSDTISRCSICLAGKEVCIPAIYSLTGKPENYPLQLLFHEGQTFHSTCANFWTNVVQERLPNLSE